MKPLTKAFVKILNHKTTDDENERMKDIYTFIEKELLGKDQELCAWLRSVGVEERDMAAFVFVQYVEGLSYDTKPRWWVDGDSGTETPVFTQLPRR